MKDQTKEQALKEKPSRIFLGNHIIDSNVISTKTTKFEEIEEIKPVDRIIQIEDLPEVNITKLGDL